MEKLAEQAKENLWLEKLWQGLTKQDCEACKKDGDCEGRLNYDSLCSNIKYLKEYGEKNYQKNRETFEELRKIMGGEKPLIFSFGCGLALDHLGATEVFGDNGVFYPIDERRWAIMDTTNYKKFEPELPERMLNFDEGMMLLGLTKDNPIICFFNSLFIISENTLGLKKQLISALETKSKFYFVCNYTMNNNLHLPSTEIEFIEDLLKGLKHKFNFKKLEILHGKGIIVLGTRK